MSNVTDVVVRSRESVGTGHSRRLRRLEARIPAVVYGLGDPAVTVSVDPKLVNKILHSETGLNTVLNLSLEGTDETRHVMIKDMARNPVSDRLTHVDFLRIDMDKKVRTVLPLEFVGQAQGVKLGGILTLVRHELEIECLPKHLRGHINVDISKMGINSTLRIGDIEAPEGVEFILGPKRTLATVRPKGVELQLDDEDEG